MVTDEMVSGIKVPGTGKRAFFLAAEGLWVSDYPLDIWLTGDPPLGEVRVTSDTVRLASYDGEPTRVLPIPEEVLTGDLLLAWLKAVIRIEGRGTLPW